MFVVQATSSNKKIGTLAAELPTKNAALKSARHLRKQGFLVTITGRDGKPVDETNSAERETPPSPPGAR